MLGSCGYNDNSSGGGGDHCWDLDPVSPLPPSPSLTSNTNIGTPTLKGILIHLNCWLKFYLVSSVHQFLPQYVQQNVTKTKYTGQK